MEDPEIHKKIPDLDKDYGFFQNPGKLFGFGRKSDIMPRNFSNLIEFSLFNCAEKVLMARKSPTISSRFNDIKQPLLSGENGEDMSFNSDHHQIHGETFYNKTNKDDSHHQFDDTTESNEFPLNFLAFLAFLMLRSVGFQVQLLARFFTLPIWLSYIFFIFLMFPFQTLMQFKAHLKKKMFTMWEKFYVASTSLIFDRFIHQNSIINLVKKFGCALCWSIFVCFMLVGMLLLGFVIGALTMRGIVEEPIEATKSLNFDYTKASPVAFVPLMSSPAVGVPSALFSDRAGERFIPYNHKLQLTVTLTVPESEYNRKLGVFQVRVEFLSANGKVTASSSYPCMLLFKSQHIRYIETLFKSLPLIAGFQSESQILNIKIRDFTEGYEPTACLKVILEQRAEYQSSAGIPEIYAASLALESELPQIKRIIWHWRRTMFVWTSFMSFLTVLAFVLIFFRPLILPRGKPKTVEAKMDAQRNKISWCS